MIFKKSIKNIVFAASLVLFAASCQKDAEVTPSLTVPNSYEAFTNVNYSGQTERLDMLAELSTYMKTATTGANLDAQKMLNMFDNVNNPFSKAYSPTKKLKDKCFSLDVASFESYFQVLAANSQSKVAGKNGVAGIVTSKDGTKKYLFDEKGMEYIQIIEKGIMGAVFYYQAAGVYLEADKMNADNIKIVDGEGTALEHYWDEAFGYFGAPKTFPVVKDGERFFAKYASARDAILLCNAKIMNEGFLRGRAAISAKNLTERDAAIKVVREEWEKIIASCAISYFNGAKRDFADDALRNHQLSEAVAFVGMLKYNPMRKMTPAQILAIQAKVGKNLYEVSPAQILEARDELSKLMNLDSIKESL